MDEVTRECGEGWKVLIDALVAECAREGVTIAQIKEKFGGLRFYVDSPTLPTSLAQAIAGAETLSYYICEDCGKPGQLSSNGRWLKTLCEVHRETRGYGTCLPGGA